MEDNMDLKIKFVQTDLTDKGFLYKKMMQYGNIFNPSLIYENSDYISKLNALNNYVGGSIVKRTKENTADKLNKPADNKISDETAGKSEANVSNREEEAYSPNDYFICYNSKDESVDKQAAGEYEDFDFEDGDFEDFDELDDYYDDYDDSESGENINLNEFEVEFNTTGRLSVSKNQITITYDEGDLVGLNSAMVNIMMDSKNPDIITIQKDNYVKSTLTLEKNKKSISDYNSNFPAVTVAVKTLEMMNSMTKKGGEINLLYTVEANGSPTEMVSYSLSAQRILSGQ